MIKDKPIFTPAIEAFKRIDFKILEIISENPELETELTELSEFVYKQAEDFLKETT